MAQAKKKQATKTAKKQTCSAKSTKQTCRQKSAHKTACCNQERNHVFIVTAMGMVTVLLLWASVAMMMA